MNDISIADCKGDEADISFLETHIFEQQGINNVIESAKPENQPGYNLFDGETCVDCGDDIPEGRLKHKFIRCIHCATKLENLDRLYGKR